MTIIIRIHPCGDPDNRTPEQRVSAAEMNLDLLSLAILGIPTGNDTLHERAVRMCWFVDELRKTADAIEKAVADLVITETEASDGKPCPG